MSNTNNSLNPRWRNNPESQTLTDITIEDKQRAHEKRLELLEETRRKIEVNKSHES